MPKIEQKSVIGTFDAVTVQYNGERPCFRHRFRIRDEFGNVHYAGVDADDDYGFYVGQEVKLLADDQFKNVSLAVVRKSDLWYLMLTIVILLIIILAITSVVTY